MELFQSIKHIGGHPSIGVNALINIRVDSIGIYIDYQKALFQKATIFISKTDIIAVSFEDKKERSTSKTIAGALVGGVLTGGIGIVAGAAIGAKSKNKSQLYITVKTDNREFEFIIEAGIKTPNLLTSINRLFI